MDDHDGHVARTEFEAIGGVASIANGEWFLRLVGRSLRAYTKNGNAGYFREKYPGMPDDLIANKLIQIAAKNAGLVGMATGAAMTADELAALAGLGLTLPANLAIAAGVIGADLVGVTHIQLKLIIALADLNGAPLKAEDPEDVLFVLGYFARGLAADAGGAGAAKAAGVVAGKVAKTVFSKETLKLAQVLGKAIGLKILQRTIRNVAVPVVSIGLGAGANFVFTRSLGRKAAKDMKARAEELRQYRGGQDGQKGAPDGVEGRPDQCDETGDVSIIS